MEINPNDQKPATPVSKKKTSSWLIAAVSILMLTALAGAWLIFSPDNQTREPEQTFEPNDITSENAPELQLPVQLSQPAQIENKKPPAESLVPDEKKAAPVAAEQAITPQQQCDLVAENLIVFFNHLDNEPYIKEFKLNQPALKYFSDLATKLLTNPPVVTRESDDLYTILTNMAHFFRIIGRQNILLMKGILDRERDKIEDVAAELYKWTIVDQCTGETFQMNAPLDKVYEYAGFFLNTMGGRSYLFRRDSRSRLLVNYYSILIIDRANKENMNQYGLDIREIIPKLIQEIEATNQLIYKEDYIDKMYELLEKYQEG